MDKKLVVFHGSPRRHGVTGRLLDEIVHNAQLQGAKVTWYDLNAKGIRGCQGCYFCRNNEGCTIKDDALSTMIDDIKTATGILFGTPIYYSGITGQSKVWLDRMTPMISGGEGFKPRYPGKKVVTAFTQGVADIDMNATVFSTINQFMNAFGWEVVDSIVCSNASVPDYQFTEEVLSRAKITGIALTATT